MWYCEKTFSIPGKTVVLCVFNKSIQCIAGEKCSFQTASLMCLTWNCWFTTDVKNSNIGIKLYVAFLMKGKSYKTLKIMLK